MTQSTIRINTSNICSVDLKPASISNIYYYKKGLKFLFITIREEGIYQDFCGTYFIGSVKSFLKDGAHTIDFVGDKAIIRRKAHLVLRMSNEYVYLLNFDSEKDAIDYLNKINTEKWIEITPQ